VAQITRFPLTWPVGWKRTPADRRVRSKFSSYKQPLTVIKATSLLQSELGRLGVPFDEWTLSTNVELRMDGFPRSDRGDPRDPGAAVYFRMRAGGKPKVFACDKWDRVADNVAAIAKHIECLRAVDRYGVGEMEQVLAGYTALPPSAVDWRSVFQFGPDETPRWSEVERRYKAGMVVAHPDRPDGDSLQAARLNTARDMARQELQAVDA
jgi:hypothetical protein